MHNVAAIKNFNSIIEQLKKAEDKLVESTCKKYGLLDPRDKFKDFLVDEKRGTRRFLIDFNFVKYQDLILNQVASQDFDKTRCLEHLLPIFEKEGMLYPVFTSKSTLPAPNRNLETGAHRAWTENHRGNDIAAYDVSEAYDIATGKVKDSPLAVRRARIKANPPSSHRDYSMQDVADQCKAALRDDPYYEGLNPSGKMPPLKPKNGQFGFNDLIDDLYNLETFPAPTIRGKIYKLATNGIKPQMILTLDFNRVNSDFLRLGWQPGLSNNGKSRVPFVEHLDTGNNSLILETDSNGGNLKVKLYSFIDKYFTDKEYQKLLKQSGIKYIKVYAKIYKPNSDIASLQNDRNNFFKEIQRGKSLFKSLKIPVSINEVYFPKQLDISQDQGQKIP